MGRKLRGTGKLLYLLLALALIFPLGCSLFKERKEPEEKKDVAVEVLPQKGGTPPETVVEPPPSLQETEEERKKKEASERLAKAKDFLAKNEYEAALRESQSVLRESGKATPGDEALFTMALVYAHPKNQKKDFRKSLALFRRLLKEYRQSSLAEEAKIWISVLQLVEQSRQAIEKSKQVDVEIEEMKKGLAR
ncbi:MAG: hypothetical protein HGA78_02960 [Nitrospirales bacterium]|nr:hypothetical protein [Nitrospirales bacterium]